VTRPGLAIETLTVELWARRPRASGEMPRYGELVLPTAAAGPLTPFPADSMDPAGPAVRTGADRSPHPCQSTGCPLIPIPRKLHEPHHSTIDTCPPTTGAPTLPHLVITSPPIEAVCSRCGQPEPTIPITNRKVDGE
jgi:hypothetical protein